MNIKLPLLLGALVTAALPAAADDFGIWSEATLQKSLGKKLSIDGEKKGKEYARVFFQSIYSPDFLSFNSLCGYL